MAKAKKDSFTIETLSTTTVKMELIGDTPLILHAKADITRCQSVGNRTMTKDLKCQKSIARGKIYGRD